MNAIAKVLDRHTEDAAFLWLQRDAAVYEPHYDLSDLAELDNRLAAHLDGLLVGGETSWPAVLDNLSIGEPGEFFVATWLAINLGDGDKVDSVVGQLISFYDEESEQRSNIRAFISALAWCPSHLVEPWLKAFLQSNQSLYRLAAITASALHRLELEESTVEKLWQEQGETLAMSLRYIGVNGDKEDLPRLKTFYQSDDTDIAFWSVWSGVLLGDRASAHYLKPLIQPDNKHCHDALQLYLRVLPCEDARQFLQQLAKNKESIRLALQGAGITGDPFWIPGLLNYMAVPELARVAGESLSMVTGLDLAYLDLDMDEPERFEAGPTEDSADENVELDQDEDLPWPNKDLLSAWWQENKHQYQPGKRYLCGALIDAGHCEKILKSGYQRQRSAAALELALLVHPYYETRKPGFVQKAELLS